MASISPPTSLASFSYPHGSSSKLRHVTLGPVHGSSEPMAVAAVQGDGVWTYDLTTLRPSTTFTVPPSTSFTTAPLSFMPGARRKQKQKAPKDAMDVDISPDEEDRLLRTTLIGINKGENVSKDLQGRVIWAWRGEEGDKKTVVTLPSPIQALHHVRRGRHPVLCVHLDGSLTLLDYDLKPMTVKVLNSEDFQAPLMASGLLQSEGTVIKVVSVDKEGTARLIAIRNEDEDGFIAELQTSFSLSGEKEGAKEITSVDIGPDGSIIAITSSGSVIARSLNDTLKSTQVWPRIPEASNRVPLLSLPNPGLHVSLLPATHSSPTLLLGSMSPSLPAVLSTIDLSPPTTTKISITELAILSRPSPSTFTVGAVLTYRGDEDGRSVIHILEVGLPEKGVGMNNLIGTADLSRRYLMLLDSSSKKAAAGSDETVLRQIELALSAGDSSTAGERFSHWLTSMENRNESDPKTFRPDENLIQEVLRVVLSSALPRRHSEDEAMDDGQEQRAPPASEAQESRGPYANDIVKQLINKGWIKDTMWPGGVICGALLPLADWENILRALKRMPHLSSESLVTVIQRSVSESAMLSPRVSLSQVLQRVLALPSPPPDYRRFLHAILSSEDCIAILLEYASWLDLHPQGRANDLTSWTSGPQKSRKDLPALESIIAHLCLLLDAHLPRLLDHPPAWEVLERLQESLIPLLAMQDSYRRLRAPVEAVLTLSRRETRRREEREAKREVLRAFGQNGKKGKGKSHTIAGDARLGAALPDEAIGKWRVEDIIF